MEEWYLVVAGALQLDLSSQIGIENMSANVVRVLTMSQHAQQFIIFIFRALRCFHSF